MKRILILLLSLLSSAIMLNAQNQQGYVKTKGRLGNNGVVVAGTRLPGATITVKGSNAVVSGNKGTFTLAIPNNNYYLQNVQKQGYVLTDPDVLSKQYAYSKNPLVLVLETPEEQSEDKLEAMMKIRTTLQDQLMQSRAEIKSLKEQNKLTQEEYRKKLQELASIQESNEKLVNDMAERYSKIDYDQLDEFNARISDCILNGRLQEADSLIKTKGDINTRAVILRQHQEANAQAEQELQKGQKKLEKSKAMTQKELEDLAQDCYSKFEIFKMQHLNDSAAYYIEFRANLDSTNVEWCLEAGGFAFKFIADIALAEDYYERALNNALLKANQDAIANCYNDYGVLHATQGDFIKGLEYQKKALTIHKTLLGVNNRSVATNYSNAGYCYANLGDLPKAIELFDSAMVIQMAVLDEKHDDIANSYINVGMISLMMGNYEGAINNMNKALAIFSETSGQESFAVATCLNNLSSAYLEMKDYTKASEYAEKSLRIRLILTGEKHPEVAISYMNIGGIYKEQKKYEEALAHFEKALTIFEEIYGNNNADAAYCYNNIGAVYCEMDDYDKAMENHQKALKIRLELYGDRHLNVATSYNNIGYVYDKQNNDEKALDYYYKSLDIRLSVLGNQHRLVAATYSNIASVYEKQKKYEAALEYYRKAELSSPSNYSKLELIKEKIKSIQDCLSENSQK